MAELPQERAHQGFPSGFMCWRGDVSIILRVVRAVGGGWAHPPGERVAPGTFGVSQDQIESCAMAEPQASIGCDESYGQAVLVRSEPLVAEP